MRENEITVAHYLEFYYHAY